MKYRILKVVTRGVETFQVEREEKFLFWTYWNKSIQPGGSPRTFTYLGEAEDFIHRLASENNYQKVVKIMEINCVEENAGEYNV